MPRVITNVKDFETWKSNIQGDIWLKRFDRKGDIISEVVRGGQALMILPEERRMNQEIAAEQSLDFFQNGMLTPVKLIETAEDFEDLQGNPNHITEDDMKVLLANPKGLTKLKATLSGVTNPLTLGRFLAMAEDPELDCTVKQIAAVKERLHAVTGETPQYYTEVETAFTSDGREVLQTSAPNSKPPRNLSSGRR